ncbi:putative dehydrogenase [Catalinimonas alkaloidigena]|uniref:Gfo/Idh/MocA family protein n=1 Tax=Catalinimonas alkaloidigena TaxID=1075417 RepID=UPI002405D201|nr:Gfo/Idh/MocA family oxidoreductase [Catalinimonas alkaloidigena]MDF9798536.1 putative dehydrogenase [Catalinimonas alkaloidigena]
MNQDSSKQKTVNRRNFVKGAALSATGFMIMPRHVLGGKGFVPPSDKVNIGIIGAGGKGRKNTEAFLKLDDVQVTAIADPAYYWNLADFYYRSEAGRGPVMDLVEEHYAAKTPNFKVAEYLDFREMLEKETALDAIVCSTPDHSHAYITSLGLQAGKHVYCEKPLTHNIWEARQVQGLARESGLATQMGNSGHSADGIRQTVEYLRAGVIGKVREAHAWVPAGRWNPGLQGLPQGNPNLPVGFDWKLWQGPRKEQDFQEEYVPVSWRDFWMYGCGALGDFGCHDMDAATWAFNLKAPESVQIFPAGYSDENIAPYGEIGYYDFKKQGDQSALKLHWYSGGLRPELHEALPKGYEYGRRASMFVGEKGIIMNDGGNRAPEIYPESLRDAVKPPRQTIPRSNGHFRDWVDAIKGGDPSSANFEYGARLTEITLLGVLSLRMGGKKIDWDYEQMKAKGLPEADQFIKEPVRQGWEMA